MPLWAFGSGPATVPADQGTSTTPVSERIVISDPHSPAVTTSNTTPKVREEGAGNGQKQKVLSEIVPSLDLHQGTPRAPGRRPRESTGTGGSDPVILGVPPSEHGGSQRITSSAVESGCWVERRRKVEGGVSWLGAGISRSPKSPRNTRAAPVTSASAYSDST
jgi:hypothetical protein